MIGFTEKTRLILFIIFLISILFQVICALYLEGEMNKHLNNGCKKL